MEKMIKQLDLIINNLQSTYDIGIYGSANFSKRVQFNLSNLVKKKIFLFDTDQMDLKTEFNIIVCTNIDHFKNILTKKRKADIVILNANIISYIYKNNKEVYEYYESVMKDLSEFFTKKIDYLQILQSHVMYEILLNRYGSYEDFKNSSNKKTNAIYCFWPWFNLYVRGNILEWCCGYTYDNDSKDNWDDKKEILDINKAFNGLAIQKARNLIASHENLGNCRNCHNFFFAQNIYYLFELLEVNNLQQKNLELALLDYWKKSLITNSYPLRYELITTFKCNYNCIMCNQEQYNKLPYALKEQDILNNLDDMKKAIEISLLGGEFFAISNAKKILDIFINNDFSNTNFVFITNGAYLHKYFEQLIKIEKAKFNISIDSVGNRYALIRKNGRWEKVESNVKELLEIQKKYDKKWIIQIHTVIMKSSLIGLEDLVKWCIDNQLEIAIIRIEANSYNQQNEDIFSHIELLKEVENWEVSIKNSLLLLKENNFINSYEALRLLLKELQIAANKQLKI